MISDEVKSVLSEGNADEQMVSNVIKKLHVKNPFDKLETIDQSVRALKKHFQYVEPVKIKLGDRAEYFRNKDGEYVPKLFKDNYQYIPILEVIKVILFNAAIRDLVTSEQDAAEGFLEKYRNGEHFECHRFFIRNIFGLQLQIYYDDLEVVNALGSRTIVHKLGAFYFRILNLPPYINSSLGGIHLFPLCNANDLKKYSFGSRVLRPFIDDLKKLENGVPMQFQDEEDFVAGTLASVCGDGLAVHELFGLLGPQCKYFCRECFITREDLLAGRLECEVFRNRQEYADCELLQQLKVNPCAAMKTATGLQDECVLNESSYFHITENHIFDATHDLLEGISPYEVKLVLNRYVADGLIDLDFLNGRIHSFAYGVTEIKNKPSAIITAAS